MPTTTSTTDPLGALRRHLDALTVHLINDREALRTDLPAVADDGPAFTTCASVLDALDALYLAITDADEHVDG